MYGCIRSDKLFLQPRNLPLNRCSTGWEGENKDAVIVPFRVPAQLQSLCGPVSLKCHI